MKNKPTHWFWAEKSKDELGDECYYIHTQGLGNHPASRYFFADLEELKAAIKMFVEDGYQNMGKIAA